MEANGIVPMAPSAKIAALLVLATVPFVGLLLTIYHLLGITTVNLGFLFMLYWMGILNQSMKDFVPSLLGGLGGIGMGWVLLGLPVIAGPLATYGGAAVMALIIFFFMRGQFRFIINNGMMLYLTVVTIADVGIARKAPEMAAALLVAAAYCYVATLAMGWFTARRAAAGAQASVAAT
ncbi:MAG TPA: hypothetical protein VL918_09905 [Sphingobium sp.]|nr:hypothetical protein [Sphingobium sp.]